MTRALVLSLWLATSATASADPTYVWLDRVPEACRGFTHAPRAAQAGWNAVLSLGGCVQDNSVVWIYESADLQPALDELATRLEPALTVYVSALQGGPDVVKVRAAFQIGMAEVALLTRARRSIVAKPGTSAEQFVDLHRQLEPLIASGGRVAYTAFALVDRAATANPDLFDDPVLDNMARTARQMMHALPAPAETELASVQP